MPMSASSTPTANPASESSAAVPSSSASVDASALPTMTGSRTTPTRTVSGGAARPSDGAHAASAAERSPRLFAMKPSVSSDGQVDRQVCRESSWKVGLMANAPQKDAGRTMDPPVCVPMPRWQSLAPTAAALPLELPPGVTSAPRGLRAGDGLPPASWAATVRGGRVSRAAGRRRRRGAGGANGAADAPRT